MEEITLSQTSTQWRSISEQKAFSEWTSIQKILFRFCFLFFGLYIFPFPLNVLPYTNNLFFWYDNSWDWLVINTGKYVLHLSYDITVQPNGSGDTTWSYVQMFIMSSLSLAGCLAWTFADKRRRNYNRLYYWFTVTVRYN